MRKTKWLLALILVILMVSCEISLTGPQTVSVNLSINDRSRTRTITPSSFQAADSYSATLTGVSDSSLTYTAESSGESISFDKVQVGSYYITVTGTLKGKKVSEGDGSITVSANTDNTATVQLEAVEDEGTGTVSVTFDWSEAISTTGYFKDMYNTGAFTFEFYRREQNEDGTYTDTLLTAPQTAKIEDTSYTFIADDIAVSDGFQGFFKMKVDDELVMELGFATYNVYAGQISVADENDTDTFKITPSNAPSNANAVYFTLSTGESDPDTTALLTVTGRGSSGNQLYKSVSISLYDETDKKNAGCATLDGTLEDDVNTLSYTFTGLTSGHKYRADVIGITKRGKKTSKSSSYITTKVFVTGIDADTPDTTTLVYNGKLSLSAEVEPANATVSTVEWATDNTDTLTLTQMGNDVLFFGNKPGKASISVSSTDSMKNGEKAVKELGTVTVTLATPSVIITTEKDSETAQSFISVSWNEAEWATSYEIWRSVDGADAAFLAETTEASYEDKDITAGCSYSYKVKAKTKESTAELNLDSAFSALSDSYTPVVPTITLVQPNMDSLKLQINEGEDPAPEDITVTPSKTAVLSVPAIEGAVSTEWYVNGKFVKKGTSVELSSDMPQVQDMDADSNALTLVATDSTGKKSSATIYFRVVAVEDTGVEAFTLSDYIAVGTEGLSIKTHVLPYDATIQSLTYSSSDESVATVDGEGNITVLKNGSVTFTVTSTSGHTTQKTVTAYNTLTPETLMSLVSSYLKTNITAADSKSGGDWWALSAYKYESNGVSITSPKSTSQSAGSLSISETNIGNSSTGEVKIKTTSDLKLWAVDGGEWNKQGYLGTDHLKYVAYGGSGTILLTLPYGQGTATITFPEQLDVISKTSGKYKIYMSKDGKTNTYDYSLYPVF